MLNLNTRGLINLFDKKIVLVAVGNTLKADDGFGPLLVNRLRGRIRGECIDAGTSPENYLNKIAKMNPEVILFIDAADLKEQAGTLKLLQKNEILDCGLTTHDISPKLLMDYLEKNCSAQIFMLAVQPKNLGFGQKMSPEIETVLSQLVNIFSTEFNRSG